MSVTRVHAPTRAPTSPYARNTVRQEVFSQNVGLDVPYDSELAQMQIN